MIDCLTMYPAIDVGVGSTLGTERWRVQANKTALAAKNTASAVGKYAHQHLILLSFAKNLWNLDGSLRTFLRQFYQDVESGKPRGTEPTQSQIREGICALKNICKPIQQMHARATAAGLTNRAFVGAALNSVLVRAEEIMDIAESVEIALDPGVDSVFNVALEELKRGEVSDLASFR